MNDSWHIPRASLTPTNNQQENNYINSNASTISMHSSISSTSVLNNQQNLDQKYIIRTNNSSKRAQLVNNRLSEHVVGRQSKRASHSSQGSNDSNTSAKSTYSGSLLLTAANLEKLAAIHKQNNDKNSKSNWNANLLLASQRDMFISIEPNLKPDIKSKDIDTMSMASSTHFTIVNNEGGYVRKKAEGICSRSKQVTVVIVSMSIILFIVILGMVYALELRARDMQRS